MSDMGDLVAALAAAAPDPRLRLRQGVIVSVESDGTATVTIAGGTQHIPGVKVAASCCPIPGAACWIARDGRDAMVLASLAPVAPACIALARTSAQSIPSGAFTAVSWSSETGDNSGMWASGTTLTVVVPGLYVLTAQVAWPASTTGIRWLRLLVDGSAVASDVRAPVNTAQTVALAWSVRLAQGAAVTVDVQQDTGSAVNLASAALTGSWLGP
ncbi:MAG: hypothetical protein Q8M17_10510 [Actinomycetota bacterium]|nr:hypothetical protein [Actinomycetota bacterium]